MSTIIYILSIWGCMSTDICIGQEATWRVLSHVKNGTRREEQRFQWALRAQECRWHHADPIGPSICVRARRDDKRVEKVGADSVLQPRQVLHVTVTNRMCGFDLERDDATVGALDDQVRFATTLRTIATLPSARVLASHPHHLSARPRRVSHGADPLHSPQLPQPAGRS